MDIQSSSKFGSIQEVQPEFPPLAKEGQGGFEGVVATTEEACGIQISPDPSVPKRGTQIESTRQEQTSAPHLIVTRNLEPIYDIPTALKAFHLLLRVLPNARLSVAGSGPELANLEALATELGIAASVNFTGRLNVDEMAILYRSADLAINPSLVDNMPNSVLEALASGVPVVSTDVGGVPYIVQDGKTALFVPPGDAPRMAEAMVTLLRDKTLAQKLIQNGLALVQQYAWPNVRDAWLSVYCEETIAGEARSCNKKQERP